MVRRGFGLYPSHGKMLPPERGRSRTVVALLGNPGGLAATAAQVIELGATDDTATNHLDRFETRAVEREDALHAFAIADLADGERAVQAGILAGDADALVGLHALAAAFDDLDVDPERVARREVGHRALGGELLGLLGFQLLKNVHGTHLSVQNVIAGQNRIL